MIKNKKYNLSYPEVYFQMSENKWMLNLLDMSEFAEKQACRRVHDYTDINYMLMCGKIERQMYEQNLEKKLIKEIEVIFN